jgi:mono/diheme cytochrome c family protein
MNRRITRLFVVFLGGIFISACGGGGESENLAITENISLPSETTGRLLASNCFQCHGTYGSGGFEAITGGEVDEVYEFSTTTLNSHIMAIHAQGYSQDQLDAIVRYLNAVR